MCSTFVLISSSIVFPATLFVKIQYITSPYGNILGYWVILLTQQRGWINTVTMTSLTELQECNRWLEVQKCRNRESVHDGPTLLTLCLGILLMYSKSVISLTPPWHTRTLWSITVTRGRTRNTPSNPLETRFARAPYFFKSSESKKRIECHSQHIPTADKHFSIFHLTASSQQINSL